MIDIKKEYRTRDGRKVTNLRYRPGEITYPFAGSIEGRGCGDSWTADGKYYAMSGDHRADLIEVQQEKTMPAIDFTKPLQTRDGHTVEIISTSARGPASILGYIGKSERIHRWEPSGKFDSSNIDHHSLDLMNVPPAKHVRYVNIYGDGQAHVHTSSDTANNQAVGGRIACVKIEYTEGQFDK